MKKYRVYLLIGAALILLQAGLFVRPAAAQIPLRLELLTTLSGYSEIPALSSPGRGRFRGLLNADRTEIRFTLTYDATESPVFMAHIHIGQPMANGGIAIWFCGDPNGPVKPPATVPSSLPLCPPNGGTVEGTITASDVIGPDGQGIAVGQFEEVVQAILRGLTYVNVHSLKYVPGEVRGQIRIGRLTLDN